MNLYRAGHLLMSAIGFAIRALIVLCFIGLVLLLFVESWQRGDLLFFFLVPVGVVGIFGVICGLVMFHDWLDRKARESARRTAQ